MGAPLFSDLDLDLAGLEAFDVISRRLPDLFAGTQPALSRRTRRTGEADVRLRGLGRDGRPVEIAESVTLPAVTDEAPEIARLFAIRKIVMLADGPAPIPDEVKAEVVALSKRFRISSPFTSLFIPEPPRQAVDRGEAVRGDLVGGDLLPRHRRVGPQRGGCNERLRRRARRRRRELPDGQRDQDGFRRLARHQNGDGG